MNKTDPGWEKEIASVSVFETQKLNRMSYMSTAVEEVCGKFQKIHLTNKVILPENSLSSTWHN